MAERVADDLVGQHPGGEQPAGARLGGGDRQADDRRGQGGEGGVVADPAGVGVADDGLGGADRAESAAVGEAGRDGVDQLLELAAVGFQRVGASTKYQAEPANLVMADGLLDGGVGREPAAGQGREGYVGQGRAAEVAVSVGAAEEQGAQPVGLCGGCGGQFVAGADPDA